MPHWGIQVRISTSCSPATPSWNPLTMPSEAMNVASEASSPTPLIAPAAFFGKTTSSIAAAMGSQRVMERRLFMEDWLAVGRWPLAEMRRKLNGQQPTANGQLREYPYEDDDPHEKHQRVIAHVAGLEEAQQVADERDEIRGEGEHAVDGEVDAAP